MDYLSKTDTLFENEQYAFGHIAENQVNTFLVWLLLGRRAKKRRK